MTEDQGGESGYRAGPLARVLRRFVSTSFGPRLVRRAVRGVYQHANSPRYGLELMNYGYASLDGTGELASVGDLAGSEVARRLSIQLYAKIAEPGDLAGKDVLEVGCGPGGGSNFLHRSRSPRTMTGLDLASRAVTAASRNYRRSGLWFLSADAEALPFPTASFDAVVNVESSHCYPDPPRFFREVGRVLRPGGWFLFADLRTRADVAGLRQDLRTSGLAVIEEEDITPNVVRSLQLDAARRQRLVHRTAPPGLRRLANNFVGGEGSPVFESLKRGDLRYLRFALQKS